jgi:acyl carrier protein
MAAPAHPEDSGLIAKLRAGRPVTMAPQDAARVVEALREAIGIVLEQPPGQIGDGARLFDDLGLDSIDVFDVLDQLAERFEAKVALEDLPADLVRGREGVTFRDFADGILAYFGSAPKAKGPGAGPAGAGPSGAAPGPGPA